MKKIAECITLYFCNAESIKILAKMIEKLKRKKNSIINFTLQNILQNIRNMITYWIEIIQKKITCEQFMNQENLWKLKAF